MQIFSCRLAIMTEPGPSNNSLTRLTSLRIFAAFAVFLAHLDGYEVVTLPGHPFRLGYTGVSFFFVLSGFVLAWGTRPGLSSGTFYRRRFARVWPSHVTVLVAAALLPTVAVGRGWDAAIPNLLLVQAWWRDDDVAYGMNGVSWSLSCEVTFYLLFPLVMRCAHGRRSWLLWAAAIVALAAGAGASLVFGDYAYHSPLARLGEFLLGMAAGAAFANGWRPRLPLWAPVGAIVGGLLVSYVLPYPTPNQLMALSALVLILFAASRDVSGRTGWLRNPVLVFAGEVSFAFYLVHELVILNVAPIIALPTWADLLIITVVSAGAATALHLLVERPANQWLRGRHGGAAAPATAEADPLAPTTSPERHPGLAVRTRDSYVDR
jgi:peptidoglycan/LPS O-acetylase OafA/YrhL